MVELLVNALITPDGTRLVSHSRYDYKEYVDANGKTYMVDGGLDYQRRSNHGDEVDDSLYTDDEFAVIRENVAWGTYGKNGDQPLKYIPISEMTDAHIQAVLETQSISPKLREVMTSELEYRDINMIKVVETSV